MNYKYDQLSEQSTYGGSNGRVALKFIRSCRYENKYIYIYIHTYMHQHQHPSQQQKRYDNWQKSTPKNTHIVFIIPIHLYA